MNFTFRPAVERLDARELPAVLMTGVFVAPPPKADDAPAAVQLAQAPGTEPSWPKSVGYDVKTPPKV